MPTSPIQLKSTIDLAQAQAQAIAPVLFELITKDLGVAISITDVAQRYVWVNQSFETLTGYSFTEAVGGSPNALLQGPDTDPQTRAYMAACLARQEGFETEVLNYRPNGNAYWVNLKVRALLNANGTLAGFIATQNNVSERREVQSTLAQREALLRSVGDNLPEGYIYQINRSASGEMRYRYVSKGVTALTGLLPEDVLSGAASPMEQQHPDDRERMQELIEQGLLSLKPFDYQGRRLLPSGELRWWHHRSGPTLEADGSTTWNGVLMDITQRKRAEADRDFNMLKLEAQNAELTEISYTVSHDLRSPLVTIRGFSGLAKRAIRAGETELAIQHLERIDRASGRMVELLNDLLDLSRIGRVTENGARESLNVLTNEVLETLHAEISQSGAQIEVQADMPAVFGELSRIKQVLANLLTNAIKFACPGEIAQITISGSRIGNSVELKIADKGRGIPVDFQSKLFGLFQRFHTDVEGTGIGLALVKRIVDLHHGEISVHSAGDNQGSLFAIRLPV